MTDDLPQVPIEPGTAGPVVDGSDADELERSTSERRLDPAVVRLWRAGLLLRAAGWAAAAVFVGQMTPWNLPWPGIAATLAGVGTVLAVVWPPVRYRSWRFRMRDHDLVVRFGVFWRTVSVIPYARIQHVDTRHGPLERWLGLSSVIVYTAGVRGADVAIPGLNATEAEALRERLAGLGGGEDAV